jgi:hypothetical protein
MLDGAQIWSGRCREKKILAPVGIETHLGLWWESQKERDHEEDLYICGGTI